MIYKHAYRNETEFDIIEVFDDGSSRIISSENNDYKDWIQNNVPEKIPGDRFVTIDDEVPKIVSNKDDTIESEKWESLRARAENDLKDSEWMLITDSTLTTDQKTVAKAYRKSIMDLKKDYETADEAIAAFEALKKPDYKLW